MKKWVKKHVTLVEDALTFQYFPFSVDVHVAERVPISPHAALLASYYEYWGRTNILESPSCVGKSFSG